MPFRIFKDSPLVKTHLQELRRAEAYWDQGWYKRAAIFHLQTGTTATMPDVTALMQFLKHFPIHFSEVAYLASLGLSESFLNYLQRSKFDAELYFLPQEVALAPGETMLFLKGQCSFAQIAIIPVFHHLNQLKNLRYELLAITDDNGGWQLEYDAEALGGQAKALPDYQKFQKY